MIVTYDELTRRVTNVYIGCETNPEIPQVEIPDQELPNYFNEYILDDSNNLVHVGKSAEQIEADRLRDTQVFEQAISEHLDMKAQELGYDNINSISKYLVAGNPFQAECESLSLWCANVWQTAYQIQQDGTATTVEELMALLPIYQ